MLRTVVNVHVFDDATSETVLGEHAFYNLCEQGVEAGLDVLVERLLLEKLRSGDALSAGISGIAEVFAVSPLVAGQTNFVGIDDDDVVTALYEGRVGGLVLASEDEGNCRTKTTENLVGSIDYYPFAVALLLVGG